MRTFSMFLFSEYLNVVAQFCTSNVQELVELCAIHNYGVRIDLGGVAIVDKPVNDQYVINVTMCNGCIIPRPIFQCKGISSLYDKQCIKDELTHVPFPMNVQMHGDRVIAFVCGGNTHIAIPDLQESCEIANLLGIYDDMTQKRSINAAILTFAKSMLPELCFQGKSDLVLCKTAFVFCEEQLTSEMHYVDCVDIRRCYTNALVNLSSEWAHFSCLDDISKATLQNVLKCPGRYYVTTRNYFPLKGNGWYYHTLLRYCFKHKIEFEVHYGQKASIVYPSNLFKAVVSKLKDVLSAEHSKTVINRFIGMLKTKSKESVKCFVTKNCNEAHAFLKSTYASYMTKDAGMYICQTPKVNTCTRPSSRHFYDQVIERSWVLVHELWNTQRLCGARLLHIKTDAVTVVYGTDLEMNSYILDDAKYRRENVQELKVERIDESMPLPELMPDVQFINVDHTYEWDGSSVCFVGRAGTSKSTKMRQILDKHDGVVISPTNRAASCFTKGMTIHKFFGVKDINCTTIKTKKIHEISRQTKLLLVDEVFMCSSWMLEALYQLHLLGTTLVFAGDPYQLPAVSGKALTCNSETLRVCVNDRFMCLSQNMRCSEDLSKELSLSVINNEFTIPDGILYRECDFSMRCHLTFTNACSFKINDLVLKHEIRRHRTVLWFDEYGKWFVSTGIKMVPDGCIAFTHNSPVTVRESCAYGIRNERVTIQSFTSAHVIINDRQFNICTEMSYLLRLAYSMTIHKAQGCTINEKHQIHEINKIKKNKIGCKLLYVALTRTSHLHFVCICRDCKCEQKTAKQLSQRDLFT